MHFQQQDFVESIQSILEKYHATAKIFISSNRTR